jgi:hypothetical protein
VGDPIRPAERSESAVGLGAAPRRVFRANSKNRSQVEELSEKLERGTGRLPNHPLEAQVAVQQVFER